MYQISIIYKEEKMKCGTYIRTEEHKRKLSKAMNGNKYCLGRVMSKETRAKISKAKTGRTLSDEAKANISAGHIGLKQNEETKEKRAAAIRGSKNSRWKGGKTAKWRRHAAKRKRNLGYIEVYPVPKDSNAWDMHHIDSERVIPVLRVIHQKYHHVGPWFLLEGLWG